ADDPKAVYKIEGTDAVGQVASKQLRNQAIAVTIAALVGMLIFIAFRFEWTYGAAAVIAVFHTVLVTLGLFSIFQIEINLNVLTGFVNGHHIRHLRHNRSCRANYGLVGKKTRDRKQTSGGEGAGNRHHDRWPQRGARRAHARKCGEAIARGANLIREPRLELWGLR